MNPLKRPALDEPDVAGTRSGHAFFQNSDAKSSFPSSRLSPPLSIASTCSCSRLHPIAHVFSLFPNPVVVLDKDNCVVQTSKSYPLLFGTPPRHIQGHNFFDVVRGSIVTENLALVAHTIHVAAQSHSEQRTEPLQPGQSSAWWRLRALPICNEHDELLYVIIEGQDATHEVEQAISRQAKPAASETYRNLVSNIRDYAIFMLDPKGHVSTWNTGASILKQYSRDEILGKHFSTFYTQPDRISKKPDKELELALRDGKVEDEGWRVKKDGSRFWANVIIAPVYREGVLQGFSKVTRDLTERKAGEARLIAAYEESSKLKSDFLANMSHEIRTPMHGMLTALGLLIDTGLTEPQRELANIIDESGGILLQVINDILDYSKLASGAFSITKEAMNVAEIVAAVQRCCKVGSDHGPSFEIAIDSRVPSVVQSDPLRYRQILQNLVSNAVKFTEHGYIRLAVAVSHEDDESYCLRTEVTDTGIGVPSDSENFLFTPFTQLDKFSTKRYKGTGLGLSICKSLAELMGGSIGYRQNSDGPGSTFFFTANVHKLDSIPNKTATSVPVPDVDIRELAQNKQLLLVEDNVINQTVMVRLLNGFGFARVDVAADGAEGLKLIKQKPLTYSIVLMDISMPVMDGVTATQQIRASGSQVPIIAMTANALKGDEEAYLAKGMNGYVAKPVDQRLLLQTLIRWLR
ncbi:hypothetical protein PV10_09223 [Exophiala mesophila]|uniref:Two-component system protein A n=1 Tax=Exophiala mesophila TaxID=212818 RepID=A0A0D1WGQ5_EXOME|nr:uncharacterized protein PV10_09223 [Exophiala mesophila]KIV87945.1 hypothetical protein PV10_09223 [Exophiala mesophila]